MKGTENTVVVHEPFFNAITAIRSAICQSLVVGTWRYRKFQFTTPYLSGIVEPATLGFQAGTYLRKQKSCERTHWTAV